MRDDAARGAADNRAEHLAGNRADLELLALGRLRGAVAQHHVAHLVRHHARDFALVMRRFDHPAVEEHRPAGQGERVDLLLVDDAEGVAELGMLILRGNDADQTLTDAGDVLVDRRIVEQRQLFLYLRRGFLSELHIVGRLVFVGRGDDMGLRRRGAERDRKDEDGGQPCVSECGHG